MATNLFRLYRSAAHVAQCRAAPAPSGGVYVAEGDVTSGSNENVSNLLRLSSSGAVVWDKAITLTSEFYVHPWIASNSTHLVVGHEGGAGTGVTLYLADGTEVWSTNLPFYHFGSTGAPPYDAPPLALGPDNSVFAIGAIAGSGYEEAILVKLDVTDGSIEWSVNLRDAGSAASGNWPGSMSVMTGGDIVVHVRGVLNYVLRLDGTDGSVVWSKGVVWPSGNPETAVGTDGDDNVYLCGRAHTSGTKVLPVVKLDADGATLWNRNIVHGSGLSGLALSYLWSGRLTCDATGVFIQCYFGDTLHRSGHVFVPADGTVATGTALVAAFGSLTNVGAHTAGSAGGTDVHSAFAYYDAASPSATYAESVVVVAGSSASEDGSWGGRDRDTYGFDVQSGSATVSTQTYTRASMPSFSASSFSFTEGAGTLLVETFVETYLPSSIDPATAFGTPRLFGVVIQDPTTVSTAFGDPRLRSDAFPTSVGPLTAFGTAAYSDDRSTTATGLAAGTTFGLAWAERDPLPGTPTTVAAAPSTAFGRPTVNGAATVTAEGASSTAFGTPASGWVCPVTGFEVGAFGTPVLSNPVRATGLASTVAFGLGMTAGFGSTTGAAPSTAFGLPVATFGAVGVTTGSADTAFGTPSTLNNRQRTRSGVFRTQWGLGQAERTAP